MESHLHLTVVFFTMIGALLGGWLIDADHSGTVKEKINCILKPKGCDADKIKDGFLHKPVVAFSVIGFMLAFSISFLIHLLMDYVRYVK